MITYVIEIKNNNTKLKKLKKLKYFTVKINKK